MKPHVMQYDLVRIRRPLGVAAAMAAGVTGTLLAEWAIVVAIVSIGVPALIVLDRTIDRLRDIRGALHSEPTALN